MEARCLEMDQAGRGMRKEKDLLADVVSLRLSVGNERCWQVPAFPRAVAGTSLEDDYVYFSKTFQAQTTQRN